jgi:hypothetical protein
LGLIFGSFFADLSRAQNELSLPIQTIIIDNMHYIITNILGTNFDTLSIANLIYQLFRGRAINRGIKND